MARPPHILVVPYPAQGQVKNMLPPRLGPTATGPLPPPNGLAITVGRQATQRKLPCPSSPLSLLLPPPPTPRPPFRNYPIPPSGVENTRTSPHSVRRASSGACMQRPSVSRPSQRPDLRRSGPSLRLPKHAAAGRSCSRLLRRDGLVKLAEDARVARGLGRSVPRGAGWLCR
ncbi:uncharacterized protein A4U43_C01F5710 [Asparagus officinalis]|uniref:Uncharacterized protein n=1 Tax=Asparagus officinalis TaxID=4686 RepID=A0A5P1FMT7_ASPOF|nr:uncharacterized protein A4U43_C01F5710 [Asparagus officinalis]